MSACGAAAHQRQCVANQPCTRTRVSTPMSSWNTRQLLAFGCCACGCSARGSILLQDLDKLPYCRVPNGTCVSLPVHSRLSKPDSVHARPQQPDSTSSHLDERPTDTCLLCSDNSRPGPPPEVPQATNVFSSTSRIDSVRAPAYMQHFARHRSWRCTWQCLNWISALPCATATVLARHPCWTSRTGCSLAPAARVSLR
jgi:hypothetical protein